MMKKKIEIIPAIDLIDGKCVRLSQGDYTRCTTYAEDPLKTAMRFEQEGLKRLHLVDLDGARTGRPVNLTVLEHIAARTGLQVDFSGGVRSGQNIRDAFDAGARWVCLGSMAQEDISGTKEFLKAYGNDRLIIGADVWGGNICIRGWQKVTRTTISELIEAYSGELKYLMCTDISRDGMLNGPDVSFYGSLKTRFPELEIIASGGVGQWEEVDRLDKIGVSGVIIGKAWYEGKISFSHLNG